MGRMSDLNKPFEPFKASQAASVAQATKGDDKLYEVELPSGARIGVPTQGEADHLTLKVQQYKDQYALENVSDLGEVDRCLTLELQSHRIAVWLGARVDYDNKSVDENALTQRGKEISGEIRQIKKTLGIDKVSRDRQTGKGSTYERWNELLNRARRFGLMRNQQSAKSIELAMELKSLMTVRSNCRSDAHRRKLRCTDEDIFEWITEVFIPEFDAIDEYFREHDQSMWILSQ